MSLYAVESESRTWQRLGKFPLLFDPIALWMFDGSLDDASGNGRHLSVAAGEARYDTVLPGVKSLLLHNTRVASSAAALHITGDVTTAIALRINALPSSGVHILSLGHGTNETEAYNFLYSSALVSAGLQWLSEHAAGSNDIYVTSTTVPLKTWGVLTSRRSSNVASLRWSGVTIGTSGTLTTPTGGTSASLSIGGIDGDTTNYLQMNVLCAAVYASALSDSAVEALEQSVYYLGVNL